jgi:uncharacterized protein YycO
MQPLIEPSIETIRLLFSNRTTIGAPLIRVATNSIWAHVALIDDESNEVIEAMGHAGVRARSFESAIAAADSCAIVTLRVRSSRGMIAAARACVGQPYSYKGIANFPLRFVGFQFTPGDDEKFCSSLIAYAEWMARGGWFRDSEWKKVTPQHLWMLEEAYPTAWLNNGEALHETVGRNEQMRIVGESDRP